MQFAPKYTMQERKQTGVGGVALKNITEQNCR